MTDVSSVVASASDSGAQEAGNRDGAEGFSAHGSEKKRPASLVNGDVPKRRRLEKDAPKMPVVSTRSAKAKSKANADPNAKGGIATRAIASISAVVTRRSARLQSAKLAASSDRKSVV